MKKLLIALLIVVMALVSLAYLVCAPLRPSTLPVEVDIAANQSLRGVGQRLATAQVVRSSWLWVLLAKLSGHDTQIKAGTYRFTEPLSLWEVLLKLEKGERSEYTVTIPEGHTFAQFRALVAAQTALRHDSAQLSDAELMQKLGVPGAPPEGLFFPDTYFFLKGSSDLALYQRAYEKMERVLLQAWETRVTGLPYQTPYQALIMASLIERETGHAEDRAQVAAVFLNRLRIGMRLQTDPTVIYGMGAAYRGVLTKRDLLTDTTYNTYTRSGLPPTPIALPGRAALNAALNPANSSALYFVARRDGSSAFSDTLGQHNQAVRRYILNKPE